MKVEMVEFAVYDLKGIVGPVTDSTFDILGEPSVLFFSLSENKIAKAGSVCHTLSYSRKRIDKAVGTKMLHHLDELCYEKVLKIKEALRSTGTILMGKSTDWRR